MNYSVRIKQSALRALGRLPRGDQSRIDEKIRALGVDPRPHKAIPLSGEGKGFWRIRIGDWRVVYEIDEAKKIVEVQIVAHHREVYRGL